MRCSISKYLIYSLSFALVALLVSLFTIATGNFIMLFFRPTQYLFFVGSIKLAAAGSGSLSLILILLFPAFWHMFQRDEDSQNSLVFARSVVLAIFVVTPVYVGGATLLGAYL
ncbi:hypothetical protein BDQ17DRAFT_1543216, partial [Cyathus striatus]